MDAARATCVEAVAEVKVCLLGRCGCSEVEDMLMRKNVGTARGVCVEALAEVDGFACLQRMF
eukprot:scaffold307234_cov13-Tisochrysis_lutea.AAC.1